MPRETLTPYFAFGSNMDIAQMQQRVGFQGTPTRALLKGYQLVFNKYATTRQCGAGNLIYTGQASDVIEGVCYQLSAAQLAKLDKNEGYRKADGSLANNPQGYQQKSVTLADGTRAMVYIANINNPAHQNLKPNVAYLKHFIAARKTGHLSEVYFNKLLNKSVVEGGVLGDHVQAKDYLPIVTKNAASLKTPRTFWQKLTSMEARKEILPLPVIAISLTLLYVLLAKLSLFSALFLTAAVSLFTIHLSIFMIMSMDMFDEQTMPASVSLPKTSTGLPVPANSVTPLRFAHGNKQPSEPKVKTTVEQQDKQTRQKKCL